MDKKTLTIIAVTALIVLVIAPKLKSLPLINKLPTV
jgi:hypothetical protein